MLNQIPNKYAKFQIIAVNKLTETGLKIAKGKNWNDHNGINRGKKAADLTENAHEMASVSPHNNDVTKVGCVSRLHGSPSGG